MSDFATFLDESRRIVEAELRNVQLGVEEVRHEVERAEARPEMPGAGALHGDERVQTADVGDQRQARVCIPVRGSYAVDAFACHELELHHGVRR